ncbi:MAG: 2-amino-4-hydroxy-6-hydroxymethyldihydropteridine diphosphokinase [Planctomycetota bacterium]|nr:2-amino-4-hydroxy-6-hydroxymethyldihydropteridine diphosphokinase [Planctomycetota bacterium]
MLTSCLIGLGANLGEPASQLAQACRLLKAVPGIEVFEVSRWLESAAVGGPVEQPAFLNAVARITTSLGPEELLAALQDIERQLGRRRDVRWGPRTLDLDLLLYGNFQVKSAALVLPHRRMLVRKFVLYPAAEVAPEMVHPSTGWTLARHADHLRNGVPYVALHGLDAERRQSLAIRLSQEFDIDCFPNCGEPMPLPGQSHNDGASSRQDEALLQWQRQAIELLQEYSWHLLSRPVLSPWWLAPHVFESPEVPLPKFVVHLHTPDTKIDDSVDGDDPVPMLHLPWLSPDQVYCEVAAAMFALERDRV